MFVGYDVISLSFDNMYQPAEKLRDDTRNIILAWSDLFV